MKRRTADEPIERFRRRTAQAEAERIVLDIEAAGLAIVRGAFSSAIIATDRRLFVFKKGILSGSLMANKLVSWDYGSISSIQLETGVLAGTVSVQAPGATVGEAKSWTRFPGDSAASKSGNAITLRREHFEQARAGVAVIRQLISEYRGQTATGNPPEPASHPADPVEQIRRLAELRDAGVVTPAEFEARKAELLSRM